MFPKPIVSKFGTFNPPVILARFAKVLHVGSSLYSIASDNAPQPIESTTINIALFFMTLPQHFHSNNLNNQVILVPL